MIPIRTDSPLRSTPWMNWTLIGVNVLVFLAQQLHLFQYGPFALFPNDPRLYQFFTYQFLHGGGLHIASNMLFLFVFGNNVNDRMGNWGYLAFYLAAGVAAGIGFVLFNDPHSGIPVVGASGAVAGVTGAYLVLLPLSHITVIYWFVLIGMLEIPSVWLVAFFFVQDFIFAFAGMSSGVAHTAHVGGSVFGFVISFLLLATRMLRRDQFDLFALFQRWNRRRQYQDMVRQGFDPFAVARSATQPAPDPRMDRIHDLRAQISESIAHHRLEDAARFYLELHAIDPQQVLSRQSQLDVANQLFAQDVHGAAADAYEAFLKNYPKYEQLEQVQLMLGVLYARYLNRPDKARQHLESSLTRLSGQREIDLAKNELAKLVPAV